MSEPRLYNFDRVAEIYDRTRGLPEDVEAQVAAGLRRLLPGAANVLEVGVGSGRIAVPLAHTGVQVTGVDIAPRMLALLHAKASGIAAVLAEASRLPFRDGVFDAALFVHILHLVPDLPGTLAETVRCLRPGGLALSCRTDHGPNAVHEASTEVDALLVECMGRPFRRRSYGAVAQGFQAGLGAGVRFEEVIVASWREEETGRHYLGELAGRVHSNTWEIPDDVLAEVLPRAGEIVERHCGGLDRPHAVEMRLVAVVAHLPGG